MWLRVVFWWWLAGLVHGSHNRKGDTCSEVQHQCFKRSGCGSALTEFIMWCSEVVGGEGKCSVPCQHALIVLTSTEEGKHFMNCSCNAEDSYCKQTKERVEVCKPHVLRAVQNETISCKLSQMICSADTECGTALKYYMKFCRSMFQGKKCIQRCHNSIKILREQEKAAKLNNCKCDHNDDECLTVKDNMDRLCFKVKPKGDGNSLNPKRLDPGKNSGSANTSVRDLVALFTLVSVIKTILPL